MFSRDNRAMPVTPVSRFELDSRCVPCPVPVACFVFRLLVNTCPYIKPTCLMICADVMCSLPATWFRVL